VLPVDAHPVALAQPRAETPLRESPAGRPRHAAGRRRQVDVVVLTVQLDQLGADVGTHLAKGAQVLAGQHPRRYLVTKTKCTLSAETTCLPRR
jgi:hypothetical protein